MATVNKRLDDLENASGGKGGHKVLYVDPDRPGEYSERYPFGEDRGKIYNEAEKDSLDREYDLLIINFVHNWRSDGESSAAFG